MDNIIIMGSSGHAAVIIDVIENQGIYKISGLIDSFRTVGETTLGYSVLGPETELPRITVEHGIKGMVIAIGDNSARAMVADRIAKLCPDIPFVTAIHPSAIVARSSTLGPGTTVMAGAVVNPRCVIGRHCIINTRSSIDHDSVMGDFSSLAPGAASGGNCRIGTCSAIGIGAVLRNGVTIGEHSVVGASALVLSDLGNFSVAYGVPAKEKRSRTRGEAYL